MYCRSLFMLFSILLQSCRAQSCTDYDLRLVGGQVPNEGRVEICVNQQWGTVCDDSWEDVDAAVVCRQLGYPPINATSFGLSHFGEGSGEIFLDDVGCNGSESRLFDCSLPAVGDENCEHYEDAAVRCVPRQCQNGEIRLVGGALDWEGRVEVCVNNDWSTVCDDGWQTPDANVACRQLGYSRHNAITYERAHFGQGNGPIGLDDVACSGSEKTLANCSYDGNTNDCTHLEDAGVRCQPELLCEDGSIRIMDGRTAYEGRVEVCFDETWGTVCNNYWEDIDASVTCRQLGFSSLNAVAYLHPGLATYSQGTGPIFLDSVTCNGGESQLADCNYDSHTANCSHVEDAGIKCQSHDQCQAGDIRLAGSSIPGSGRVEVCVNGLWGTVCDDGWGQTDASVVCKQLNYSRHNATAFSQAHFGPGSLPILMRNIGCSGSEEQLTNCPFSSQVAAICSHSEDAGVQCQIEPVCQNGDIRITGEITDETVIGRVEICFDETWGTVCNGDWNTNNAIVACRQLGYSTRGAVALTTPGASGYNQGTGPIFLDNTICDGSESRLIDCNYNNHTADCSHLEDAGVQCEFLCETGAVRLVGGQTRREGRVEVCVNRMWGTVCDDDWDAVDARVACMQLGYSPTNATAYTGARFGQGLVPIFLDNVACQGPESRLIDCSHDEHTTDCSHNEDASVQCQPLCQNGDIRLVGGGSQQEGRVEVCMDGGWGTVCADDLWDATDATVVCRQLGFSRYGAEALYNAIFGQGTVPIVMSNVTCSGTESQLADCRHDGAPVQGCFHSKDAGVRCQISADGPIITLYMRISATSMRLSWQPLTPEERGSMYHIKYRPLGSVIRQTLDDSPVVINTTDTEVTVAGLDPRVTYAVAVAASTSAGMGNYSEEIMIGLYSNSLFQLHLTGPVLCQEWLLTNTPLEILDDIFQDTARELEGVCRCSLSAEYIGDGRLHCDRNRTDAIVLRARMISTESRDSTSILSTLQQWARTSPTLVARGVQLRVRADCSVDLEEFDSSLGCVQIPTTPPSTERPTTPQPTPQQPGPTDPEPAPSIPIPAIAGAIGVVLAVVIIVILAVLVCRKQMSKEKIHHAEDLNHTIVVSPWTPGGLTEKPPIPTAALIAAEPRETAGSVPETVATNEQHVYETIPGESDDASPVSKHENQPTQIPQDSSEHTYKTNSGYDYVTTCTVRRGTVVPDEASASSKANGCFVSDKPQTASTGGGQEHVKLDMDSLPTLQYRTFGPGGAVPSPYGALPTHANPSYGVFGDSSGSDSRQEGQERSRNEEHIEIH